MDGDHVPDVSMPRERREVVVVGGGQAGLAMGHALARRGRDHVILEAGPEPATAWRERWDSLRLFTPRRYSGLPGLPMPGDPDGHPTRDEVVAYLGEYARRFELLVELSSRVRAVRRGDAGFEVLLDDRAYDAQHVVVATGPFQVPFVPPDRRHARSGRPAAPQHRVPAAAGRPRGPRAGRRWRQHGLPDRGGAPASHPVHLAIGSRQRPLPQRLLGRDLFWWLDTTGLIHKDRESRPGRRLEGRDTLVGVGPRRLRRRGGVRLHGRAVEAKGRRVRFADGSELEPRTVLWATGFGVDHSWIELPVFDERGRIVHRRGVTPVPGLYVLGLTWLHTRGSALVGWVGEDAEHLAEQIVTQARAAPSGGPPARVAASPGERP
jgi:putative flavoprotein involved in K+ transport